MQYLQHLSARLVFDVGPPYISDRTGRQGRKHVAPHEPNSSCVMRQIGLTCLKLGPGTATPWYSIQVRPNSGGAAGDVDGRPQARECGRRRLRGDRGRMCVAEQSHHEGRVAYWGLREDGNEDLIGISWVNS